MTIEQIYTNCLAEASYFIEDSGEAIVIDPIRETAPYIKRATESGTKIKYIFETHFHADFISGHLDLAKETGATIVYGPTATTGYAVHVGKDGEMFQLGKASFELMHTPGHTPESASFLLRDEAGKPTAVFTGDTLFVGDVGRPDLLDGKMSSAELASMMYDSLKKLVALPDDVTVYPAHGPGSSCGKNLGKETWSTIGEQKIKNYALQPMTRDVFIHTLTEGLTPPPQYFFADAAINKNGYDSLGDVIARSDKALNTAAIQAEVTNGALVLDVRDAEQFAKAHIRNSMNVGLSGTFALWAGAVLDVKRPLVLVAPEGKAQEAIVRLARVGCDSVKGYLDGGFDAWTDSSTIASTHSISPQEFVASMQADSNILDVRKPGEFEKGSVVGAMNIELAQLSSHLDSLDKSEEIFVHCAGGYRSMIACSILQSAGFEHVTNIEGGFEKMKVAGVPILGNAVTDMVHA